MHGVDERIAELLQRQRSGWSLDQPFYVDDDVYALDLERIWYRSWLFAAHDCEIPRAGDYVRYDIGRYSVVIVRGANGEIRAFHNTCRHRGSQICAAERGNAAKLVCPYHQWTYELDGRLLYARDMGADFDAKAFGLKPVHVGRVAGYVFVCVADETPDFAAFRAVAEPYLAPHRLDDAKVARQTTIVERGNWKLTMENNRECYHCSAGHPELCRTFPDTPTYVAVEAMERDPAILDHRRRCEAAGLPSRYAIAEDGTWRVMRMPLEREAESFTMDGRPAVRGLRLGGVTAPLIGSMLMFHFPSTWNHVLGDHATTFRVRPLGVDATEVTTKWLVPKDAVEGRDYDLQTLTHVWTMTNEQDRVLVERNHAGVASPAYEPGPYSTLHEAGVIQFVDWYRAALSAALDAGTARLEAVA